MRKIVTQPTPGIYTASANKCIHDISMVNATMGGISSGCEALHQCHNAVAVGHPGQHVTLEEVKWYYCVVDRGLTIPEVRS
jgi:hypothetical protein